MTSSSFVPTLPNVTTTAQLPISTTIFLKEIPIELAPLPTGAVLPAVITPALKPSELPTITLTLPDGTNISFQAKVIPAPKVETPASIKVHSNDGKDAMGLKIFFSTSTPNLAETVEKISKLDVKEEIVLPDTKTISTQAFVLKSVPEKITALLPDLINNETEKLPVNTKLNIEITPDDNAIPAMAKQDTPVAQPPSLQALPLPKLAEPEIIKVIELPQSETKQQKQPIVENQLPIKTVSSTTQTTITPVLNPEIPTIESVPLQNDIIQQKNTIETPIQTKPITDTVKPEITNIETKPLSQTETTTVSKPATVLQNQPAPEPTGKTTITPNLTPTKGTENIKGVVLHFDDLPQTFIATDKGVLTIEERIALPPMTNVQIKVIALPEIPLFAPTFEDDAIPVFKNTWTILNNTLETLKQTDETAFEAVKNILPQTGDKLPALMLKFMQAGAQGISFSNFIGEANVMAIKNTGDKGERLLRRLEKEFSTSAKKATDGKSSWSGWDIPLLSGQIVEPVSLYLQRPSSESNKSNQLKPIPQNSVRFVLDLNMSQLGKIQLEGLAQKQEKIFNLIIRHKDLMPDNFDNKVFAIFTNTLTVLNYAGTVKIDKTDDFIQFESENTNLDFKHGVLV